MQFMPQIIQIILDFLCCLETNSVLTRLGAVDIVHRYDKLLSEWKLLKDSEKEFKQLMGLDHDKTLVQCIDSIPPGVYEVFLP